MAEQKVVYAPQFERFAAKVKEAYIRKELKTGSETDYKVLSDNNLTDALKQKIEDAGTSSFNGSYDALSGKPSLDGVELTGIMSSENLGIATRDWVGDEIEDAKQEISDSVASVYKPKGSCDFANLPAPSEDASGNVYNIADMFVTTNDFVEGAGLSYPAGTNVVCVAAGEGVYKWDVLTGVVDLSDYVKKDELQPMTDAEIDALFE